VLTSTLLNLGHSYGSKDAKAVSESNDREAEDEKIDAIFQRLGVHFDIQATGGDVNR
jgi:hypothetical protein